MADNAADPISAIANAVGDVATAVFGFLGKKQQTEQLKETRRIQSLPQYKDIFSPYRSELGNRNLIILGIMALMVVGVVVAIALKKE
ncbi:MAG: hypothetical protein AAGJ18_20025 [Bacteroidota bacterium]